MSLLPQLMLILPVFAVLLANPAQGTPAASPQVLFYRTPQSLFASGQRTRQELLARRVQQAPEGRVLIQWPEPHIGPVWVRQAAVTVDHDLQMNTAKTVAPVNLRQAPDWHAPASFLVPRGAVLQIRKWCGDRAMTWVEVDYQTATHGSTSHSSVEHGFVDSSSLLLRVDFASFVRFKEDKGHPDATWRAVRHREGTFLILDHDERRNLTQVADMMTRPDLGIIVDSRVSDEKPALALPVLSHVHILQNSLTQWNRSLLPDHGEVYWRDTNEPIPTPQSRRFDATEALLKTDELLQKQIQEIALQPAHPKHGLVLAEAVYHTTDGENWQRLNVEPKGPLALGADGTLAVGESVSHDGGRTFQRYIRWDEVSAILTEELGHPIETVSLRAIESISARRVQLKLTVGHMSVRLAKKKGDLETWEMIKR